jgi:diketogulonate reductase-like aldo/keto reductase
VRNQKANDPTLTKIAKKHSKTTQQVLVRYSLQKDWVPLPKSEDPERIKSNADVYDFELDTEDMKELNDLEQGEDGAIAWRPMHCD